MAKVPHLPWEGAPAAPQSVGFAFANERLPPQYFHLVPSPINHFWWSRWTLGGAGTTTNVWCGKCGDNWEYGGAVNVKAYLWASKHSCKARIGPVMGEECSRLFR